MIYAEASYFSGYHFQHIVAWQEYNRLKRIKTKLVKSS
jgi:hypothetical protein